MSRASCLEGAGSWLSSCSRLRELGHAARLLVEVGERAAGALVRGLELEELLVQPEGALRVACDRLGALPQQRELLALLSAVRRGLEIQLAEPPQVVLALEDLSSLSNAAMSPGAT